MSGSVLLLAFLLLCGAGMVLCVLLPERHGGTVVAWLGAFAAAALAWFGAAVLWGGAWGPVELWTLPGLGPLTLAADRLSGLFLLVTGAVYLPGSIFAGGCLAHREPGYRRRAFSVWNLALLAAVGLVLVAADVLSLLLTWEAMSLLSHLLVLHGPEQPGRSRAGFRLLAMGEAGALAVVVALILLGQAAGSLQFQAIKALGNLPPGLTWAVFVLAFFGFGVKAGLVPVNFWLPPAYTAAPSAFVPVLAGATLNLGLYGILRVTVAMAVPAPVGPGLVVLAVGALTALVGILYATTENDLQTLLAHSSIENAGIVVAGIGAGMVFGAAGHPVLAGMAYVAALYHMTNHALFKTLLLMGSGAVSAATGTRDLDRLGGLIRRMPRTALLVLAGVLAIAALPPFNGFVSEWLTLQVLLRSVELASVPVRIVFALSGAALALTAALAVTCFAKVYAMGFLGRARSADAERASPASPALAWPMALLALGCLLLGILPTYTIPVLDRVAQPLAGASATGALVPSFFAQQADSTPLTPAFVAEFHDLGAQVGQEFLPGRGLVVLHQGGTANPVVFAMSTSYLVVVLALMLGLAWLLAGWLARGRAVSRRPAWDGGVPRLLAGMTYTATGFSNPVRVIFQAIFRPQLVEDTRETVAVHFLTGIRRVREEEHVVERLAYRPVSRAVLWVSNALARMHHGRVNAYAAYGLLALLAALILARVI
jgi:hydrogenase-4 component B